MRRAFSQEVSGSATCCLSLPRPIEIVGWLRPNSSAARPMAIGTHSVEDTQETQIDLLQAGHPISIITFFNDHY
jgi:hypothetical protein